MTTVSIRIHNLKEQTIELQVDPWAGIYSLRKGESIEIVAESETSFPTFSLVEHDDAFTVLQIEHSDEYYLVVNGTRVHYSQYVTESDD